MRDGRPVWEAIGGLGGSSLLVDAESGDVRATPPADARTRFFRTAHFWFFAGSSQVAVDLSAKRPRVARVPLTGDRRGPQVHGVHLPWMRILQ